MDYMRQLNGFWRWRQTNQVSHSQVDLYFAILAIGNSCGWKEQFTIANKTLVGMCQLSESELHKQRLVLIQTGLIDYKKGKKGQAGTYFINPLYETNMDINMDSNTAINTATNMDSNMEDILKIKHKQKQTPNKVLSKKKFTTPTIEEVRAYCVERENHVDPGKFIDFYESKGWLIGKNPMKDWQAAIRNWEKDGNDSERPGKTSITKKPSEYNSVYDKLKRYQVDADG